MLRSGGLVLEGPAKILDVIDTVLGGDRLSVSLKLCGHGYRAEVMHEGK